MHSPVITGGRISTPKFRETVRDMDEQPRLEQDVDRFTLLKLVKKAGRDAGFTAELIELLEYYVIRTQEVDWEQGEQPIFYQSLVNTAMDLDITERQVRNREKALHALGALTWMDSGNFKRYGQRDRQTQRILYAFGVDLTPLASLAPLLEAKIEKKQRYKELWREEKRKISGYRARIRALLAEMEINDQDYETFVVLAREYEAISFSIRSYHPLGELKELCLRHKALYHAVYEALEISAAGEDNTQLTCDTSSTDERDCPHIQSTNKKISNKLDYSNPSGKSLQKGVVEPPEPQAEEERLGSLSKHEHEAITSSISKITWKQVLNACSERYREQIPLHERPLSWQDLADAAYALLPTLGIHKSAWWDACSVIGKTGATICIMIIDQKQQDPNIRIHNPGGYLREMTARARSGDLNLQGSVFGLLKRSEEDAHV